MQLQITFISRPHPSAENPIVRNKTGHRQSAVGFFFFPPGLNYQLRWGLAETCSWFFLRGFCSLCTAMGSALSHLQLRRSLPPGSEDTQVNVKHRKDFLPQFVACFTALYNNVRKIWDVSGAPSLFDLMCIAISQWFLKL